MRELEQLRRQNVVAPVTAPEAEVDMWVETDPRRCGNSRLTITAGKTLVSQFVSSRNNGVIFSAVHVTVALRT